jgi:hypothetical protein
MMNQSTDNVPNSEDLDADPDRILDALQDVLTEFDDYVAAWFDRLDDTLAACDPLPGPTAEMLECDDESGMREKTAQLTAAWLRLETEQRKFLQLSAGYPHASRDLNSGGEAGDAGSSEEVETNLSGNSGAPKPIQQVRPQPSQSQSSRQLPAANRRPSRDAACQQFQKLKQQIESNRPKSN